MFKKEHKVIEFAISENSRGLAKIPQQAKTYLPKWYKDIPLREVNTKKYESALTLKACVPFLDAITSGYIFELWTDIEVFYESNSPMPFFGWGKNENNLIEFRNPESIGEMPSKDGYLNLNTAIEIPLYIKTPPGYSILITSPFNRQDLILNSFSGVVDTDKYPLYPGRIPFMLKEGFEGVIEAGTPLIQIIPFKRTDWVSTENNNIIEEGKLSKKRSASKFFGWYRYEAHSKKGYN